MEKTKRGFNVKKQLLSISAVPAALIGVACLIVAIIFVKSSTEKATIQGLLAAAHTYCELGQLHADRQPGDNTLETQLKEKDGYDYTWFDGDLRKNSSLGSSVINTKADKSVIEHVINDKEIFTSMKTPVAGTDYFVAYVPVIENGKVTAMAFTGVSRESVEDQVNKSITTISLLVILFIAITVVIVRRPASSMTAAINSINDVLNKLANGEFVKAEKYQNRSDEIGSTLQSTNTVIGTLENLITSLGELSEFINSESSELARTTKSISETVNSVSDASTQIANGATDQAETLQDVTVNVTSLSDAIENVSISVEQLTTTSSEMDKAGNSSAKTLKNLADEMNVMQKSVDSITKSMISTTQAVERVNEKTDAIDNIATQTNLLALNASIEAARAGEAGRGFAVVAEEINKLSKESAVTNSEIKAEMMNLLSQSNDAKVKSSEVLTICQKISKVLAETEEKINYLLLNVEATVSGVTTISKLTQKCEEAKKVIVDAVSSLSAISEENAAATEETSASIIQVNSSISVLENASVDLEKVVGDLNDTLKFFKK